MVFQYLYRFRYLGYIYLLLFMNSAFAGITITGGYVQSTNPNNGALNNVHGYVNNTTAVTITVVLDGDDATNLNEKYIYIKMGTNTDETALDDYPLAPGRTILNSSGVMIRAKTSATYNNHANYNDNNDDNSVTFTLHNNDILHNVENLNNTPTWVDFIVRFQGYNIECSDCDGDDSGDITEVECNNGNGYWNSDTDECTDAPFNNYLGTEYLHVNWIDGADEKISLRWDTERPYFHLWSWNNWADPPAAARYPCDVGDDHSGLSSDLYAWRIRGDDDDEILYVRDEIFKYKIHDNTDNLSEGTVSFERVNHAGDNSSIDETDPQDLPELVFDGDYDLLDVSAAINLTDGEYYIIKFTGTDIAGNTQNTSYSDFLMKFDTTVPEVERYDQTSVRITYDPEGWENDAVMGLSNDFRQNYQSSSNSNKAMGITWWTDDGFEHYYDDVKSYAPGSNGSRQNLVIVYQWSERVRDVNIDHFYLEDENDETIEATMDMRQEISNGKSVIKLIISSLVEQGIIKVKINQDNVTDYAGNPIDGTTDAGAEADIYEFKFIHDYTRPVMAAIEGEGVNSGDEIAQSSSYNGNNGVLEPIQIVFDWQEDVNDFSLGVLSPGTFGPWNGTETLVEDPASSGHYTLTIPTELMVVTSPGKAIVINIDGTGVTDPAGNASAVNTTFSFLYDTFKPTINISAEGAVTGEIRDGDVAYRGDDTELELITLTITISDIAPVNFLRSQISKSNSNITAWTPMVEVSSTDYDFFGVFQSTNDFSDDNVYYTSKLNNMDWESHNATALAQGGGICIDLDGIDRPDLDNQSDCVAGGFTWEEGTKGDYRTNGTYLVAIESSAENTYVKNILAILGGSWTFIGATDKDVPDSWQWQYSSDAPIVFGTGQGDAFALVDPPTEADDPTSWYQNWGGSYPNNNGESANGEYLIFNTNGTWRDYKDNWNSYAILEVDKDVSEIFTVVKKNLNINKIDDIENIINENEQALSIIASIAKDIINLAQKGNDIALSILQEGTTYVADYIISTFTQLDFNRNDVMIACEGSVVKNKFYRQVLNDALQFEFNSIKWITSEISSAVGAGLVASKYVNINIKRENVVKHIK